MLEICDNIWNYHIPETPICLTTNGSLTRRGSAVMGAGIALQARLQFPELPRRLGILLKQQGNLVHYLPEFNIISFPVKHHWSSKADIELILYSAIQLKTFAYTILSHCSAIYLPRPGCYNGGLDWEIEVRPYLRNILDSDRFIICDLAP